MKSTEVRFNRENGDAVTGRLCLPPSGRALTFVIFIHGLGEAADKIIRILENHHLGVLSLTFDPPGGNSEMLKGNGIKARMDDLLAAVKFLNNNYSAPSLLIGHSSGGTAALRIASKVSHIEAVATIGAPALDLKKIKIPLLLLHSPQDKMVEIDHARTIFEMAHHPKSFISLDGADHGLGNAEDAHYAGTVIASWASRYLSIQPEKSRPEKKRDVVTITGDQGYMTEVNAGRHNLIVDEPEELGGTDLGPTPYDFLVTSLGACTGMTLRMYADRKKWPLERVEVHLRHAKVHEEDCIHCDEKEARLALLSRDIHLTGDLSDDQKKRLLEIADKCPVHKTLTGEIKVETTLKD